MNLQEYVIKHGTESLTVLAEKVGTTHGYLRNLLYAKNNSIKHGSPVKTPSIKMAVRLVEASSGVLTMEELAKPTVISRSKKKNAD